MHNKPPPHMENQAWPCLLDNLHLPPLIPRHTRHFLLDGDFATSPPMPVPSDNYHPEQSAKQTENYWFSFT